MAPRGVPDCGHRQEPARSNGRKPGGGARREERARTRSGPASPLAEPTARRGGAAPPDRAVPAAAPLAGGDRPGAAVADPADPAVLAAELRRAAAHRRRSGDLGGRPPFLPPPVPFRVLPVIPRHHDLPP